MLTLSPTRRWRGAAGRLQRCADHRLTVPLLLAFLVLVIGAQVACVFKIPSWGNDEPAHIGYIGSLVSGDLPTIDSPIIADRDHYGGLADRLVGWDAAHNDVWTANHGPLFHLALVPLWKLSGDDPWSVYIAMRLANTLGFALWILLVALIARELVPRRPAVPALAALVALTPTLAMRSGFLMNDGMSSAASLLAILMTIRMLRAELTPTRLALASAAGVVAAGTRASGVLTVAVCTLVLLYVVWRRAGWRRGVVAAAVVGGLPAAATSWIYLRNHALYGDFTGQGALLEKFERAPVTALSEVWLIPSVDEFLLTTPIPLLVTLLLVPPVVTRWARTGRAVDPAWVLLGILGTITVINVIGFLADGGGFHDRYLMPIMPLPSVLVALGMLHLGRPWRSGNPEQRDWQVATRWAVALLVWLVVALWWLERHYIYSKQSTLPVGGPLPDVLVGLAGVAGVLIVITMARRGRVGR